MNRFSSMFRMNLVGWPAAIAWPWGILVAAWLVNVVIWAAMPESARANAQTFGLVSVAIVTMIASRRSRLNTGNRRVTDI